MVRSLYLNTGDRTLLLYGILNLTLPKSEEERNKVVKVNIGENNA